MGDVLRAMGIAGAILLVVLVFVVIVSRVAVNRGEAAMHEDPKHSGHSH